jgi:hypothetical protein
MFLLSGLSVQRIISELKKITNPVEEKLVSVIYKIYFRNLFPHTYIGECYWTVGPFDTIQFENKKKGKYISLHVKMSYQLVLIENFWYYILLKGLRKNNICN